MHYPISSLFVAGLKYNCIFYIRPSVQITSWIYKHKAIENMAMWLLFSTGVWYYLLNSCVDVTAVSDNHPYKKYFVYSRMNNVLAVTWLLICFQWKSSREWLFYIATIIFDWPGLYRFCLGDVHDGNWILCLL